MTSSLLPAISAGYPLPADEQSQFDVEEYLLQHPRSSFYVQVSGNSMVNKGICDGDILVVDKTLTPRQGSVVIAQVDGSFTIKGYDLSTGRLRLVPANPAYSPLGASEDCTLCGVAVFVIHRI